MSFSKEVLHNLQDLYKRGIAGDETAYSEFLQKISKILEQNLAGKITNPSERQDIIQEILISIHKARHTYDGERPIMPWINAIAKFRLTDYFRKYYAVHNDKMTDIDDIYNLPSVTNDKNHANIIEEALCHVGDREKTILTLIHIEGYSCKETGDKLNLKENAVKVIAHRAIKKIRENFKL